MHKNTIIFDNSGANLGFKSKATLTTLKNQIAKANRRNGNTDVKLMPKQRLSLADLNIAVGVNASLSGNKTCKGCNKKKVVKSKKTLETITTNTDVPVIDTPVTITESAE